MVHESEKLQYFSAAETTAKKKTTPRGVLKPPKPRPAKPAASSTRPGSQFGSGRPLDAAPASQCGRSRAGSEVDPQLKPLDGLVPHQGRWVSAGKNPRPIPVEIGGREKKTKQLKNMAKKGGENIRKEL